MKIGATADPPYKLGVSEVESRVKGLEEAGVDSLWTGTMLRGESFTLAGYVAAVSTKPRIAVGVINPYTRHPLVVARAAATLHRFSAGRAVLVLGFGWRPWVKNQLGIPREDPIGDMEVFVDALRQLFDGRAVTCEAKGFKLKEVRIGGPSVDKIPIFIEAAGKNALELAGRVADGVFMGSYMTLHHVRWAVSRLRHFKAKDSHLEIGAQLPLRITSDTGRAWEELKPDLAYFLAGEGDYFTRQLGFDVDVLSRIRETLRVQDRIVTRPENLGEAARLVPDDWVDESCLVGNLDRCIQRLVDYETAGLTYAVLSFQEAFDSVIPNLQRIVQSFHR